MALPPAGQARLDQMICGGGRFLAGAGELTASAGLGLAGERARHLGYLAESAVAPQSAPTLEQRLARKLALDGPIETRELCAVLSAEVVEVEALLTSRSCFVVGRSGWSLGRGIWLRRGRRLLAPLKEKPDQSRTCQPRSLSGTGSPGRHLNRNRRDRFRRLRPYASFQSAHRVQPCHKG
jgi:hypothetical protein